MHTYTHTDTYTHAHTRTQADRVASERAENVGHCVGYQIRLEQCRSAHTRLLFCTTGILLRTLEGDPDLMEGSHGLPSISHVIVDEVHERYKPARTHTQVCTTHHTHHSRILTQLYRLRLPLDHSERPVSETA